MLTASNILFFPPPPPKKRSFKIYFDDHFYTRIFTRVTKRNGKKLTKDDFSIISPIITTIKMIQIVLSFRRIIISVFIVYSLSLFRCSTVCRNEVR